MPRHVGGDEPVTNTLKSLLPCTPLAIIKIMEYLKVLYSRILSSQSLSLLNNCSIVSLLIADLSFLPTELDDLMEILILHLFVFLSIDFQYWVQVREASERVNAGGEIASKC